MSAPSATVTVTIAFKTPEKPSFQQWTLKKEEAERLATDFKNSAHPNTAALGKYETADGAPLAVRFADVLYIG